MSDIVKRRKAMKWMQENGVRGIKVDFFGGDKQETMRLYHDILADANDYGILVIFHGCTPAERMGAHVSQFCGAGGGFGK